ncbi:MAG: type IV pilin, partial [Candidatus Thermoplasmatota archaeon]|nr:type IV pilin [Candidatus Thermoplasmatota archaeon]
MAMRRLSVDEEGVSEVVGTILTLLITVALFGSVFATVMQLEGPDDEIRVELDAYFENQGGKNQVIMIHEGGQSLDTDSLTFFLIVDDDRHLESPIEEESSWSVGDNRTLQEENEGEWDIDENSTVELMIRNDDTNRVIYQTMLLEEDRNIIDIRNSRIEYRHEWRNYAEPYEDITIKTEIAAPVWLNNEPFDPEDMWVNASIYQDDVVVDDDGDFISSTNLNHTHNGKFEKRLRIDGGADDARYRMKITAEHPEVQHINPSYLFLNVGKESLDYYEDKLAIGSLRFEPRSPSHGDDFTLFVEVFNEGEDAQPANWKLTDDRQGTFNSTEPITISHGAAPTLIEVEEPEAYPEGIKGHGPHEITFEIIPEDEDWEGDKWKDEITVDPNIMLVRDTIPEGLYEGEMMENTIRGLNLDYSPFSVGPGEEIADLEKELARHTLTIWMTGNRSGQENYLEDDEVLDSLYDYMEGDLDNADDLNGALWLLGSNLDNIDFGDHDFTDKLGFESFGDNGTFEDETLINPARREDEITITMDKDRDIIAHFKPERVLTIDVDGEGSTDPEVGTHVYEDEEDVTVEATPDEGWYFDGWTGDVTGEKTTIDVTMDEDKEITANFKEKDEHNLTINVEGEGSTNPDVGTRTYEDGEDVTVEATPGDNSYFSHWEGDVPEGEEEEENITIVMDKDKEITAYFVEDGKYLLTIDIEGKGSTDPLEGTHTYEDGDEVNISATPNDDWEFSHWTGDYEGTEKTITITMDENKSITANFERVEYSLTIDFEGEGSVNVNDEEIEDGWTSDYEANTQIELEALPDDDWYFDKWTGDGLEDEKREEITITMDENKSITANFTEIKDHLLRISIKGEGSTDPLEGTHTYEDGEEVNISATPTEGWKFSHWTGEYGGTYGGFDYDVEEGEYVEMNRKDGVNIEDTLAFKEGAEDTSEFFGLGYEAETGQRTAVNSFLFGSITDPGLRSSMAGEVIDWLSNIAIRTGVDVSVTSQRIKPSSPMFRDEINITASFRNNGPRGLDISDTARLVRRHEGTVKDVIAPPTDTDLYLEADGGTAEVTFQWTADELGIHDLLVKADYFGQIDQVYTDNDDITYKNLDVTDDQRFVNVHFSTLVVDAVDRDNSEGFDPAVENVTDSFDRLGHEEGVDYDVFNVTDDNIDSDELQKYNAVVWVTGDNETEVFKQEDVDYILDYLEQESGGNMMFIGENILSSLDSTGINGADDLLEYMGISGGITEDDADPSVLIGEKENDLGRTLRYEVNATSIDTFDSTSDYGEVLFKDEDGNNIASTYADESSGIKTVYLGMNLGRIEAPLIDAGFDDWPGGEVNTSSENAREEFIYNSIWNFGKRDERTELRVTDYDIRSSPPHPQTGRGYSIKARIENIGYESGTALVRFAEGDEHIASQTVTVPGSERIATEGTSYFNVSAGFTTAEVSWTPMDGGMRPIRVRVDPLRSVEEIEPYGEEGTEEKIMEFRNQAKVDQPVYFFYDDMERGDGKWSYDSTLMNIDGDSPLDFMGEAEETHIKDDWNWSLSGSTAADGYRSLGEGEGVYQTRDPEINQFTDNASYSPPRSYWMAEGQGDPEGRMDRAPLDIVLVFDQAMSTGYDEAVDAAEAVIDMLSLEEHGDRIAIIYSTGASAHTELSLSDSENLTKEQIKNRIPDGQPNLPQKALLSGASVAIEELDENGSENAVGGIITITDGLSTQDADQFKYAPGGGSGDEP